MLKKIFKFVAITIAVAMAPLSYGHYQGETAEKVINHWYRFLYSTVDGYSSTGRYSSVEEGIQVYYELSDANEARWCTRDNVWYTCTVSRTHTVTEVPAAHPSGLSTYKVEVVTETEHKKEGELPEFTTSSTILDFRPAYGCPFGFELKTFYHTDPEGHGFPETVNEELCAAIPLCPDGYEMRDGLCRLFCADETIWNPELMICEQKPETESCETKSRHPIDFMSGRKYREEIVISSGRRFPFSMNYFYNSHLNNTLSIGSIIGPNVRHAVAPMTRKDYALKYYDTGMPKNDTVLPDQYYGHIKQVWRHNFDEVLEIRGTKLILHTPQGRRVYFDELGSASGSNELSIQPLVSGEEQFSGYKLSDSSAGIEKRFDSAGRLRKVVRNLDTLTLNYDEADRLASISNSEGDHISIGYESLPIDSQHSRFSNALGFPRFFRSSTGQSAVINWDRTVMRRTGYVYLITQITETPIGAVSSTSREFDYSAGGTLLSNIYRVSGGATGVRSLYAHFEYDPWRRATYSGLAGGADAIKVAYPDAWTRIVTNALGKNARYTFAEFGGVKKLSNITGEPTNSCETSDVTYTYDSNGNVYEAIKNGVSTIFMYGVMNRQERRIEAAGTLEEREILTEYDPRFISLPTRITEPGRVMEMTYDEKGRMIRRTIRSTES